jgi:hypothetical protein
LAHGRDPSGRRDGVDRERWTRRIVRHCQLRPESAVLIEAEPHAGEHATECGGQLSDALSVRDASFDEGHKLVVEVQGRVEVRADSNSWTRARATVTARAC